MWQIQWLRRLVRRHTKPIPPVKAVNWKQRLSLIYAVVAWNAFGGVCYMLYTGRRDWAKYYGYKSEDEERISPGRQWAQTLGMDNVKVVRVSGMRVTSEEEYQTQKRDEINSAALVQDESHPGIAEKSEIS